MLLGPTACGDSAAPNPDDTAETPDAGTGNSDAAVPDGGEPDAHEEAPCEGYTVPAAASVTLRNGEEGEAIIDDPDSDFYGGGVRIPGAVFSESMTARHIVSGALVINAPVSYSVVRDSSGIDVFAVDADQEGVWDDELGRCVPNVVELDSAMLAMEGNMAKRPVILSPIGIQGTMVYNSGSDQELPGLGHTSEIDTDLEQTVARATHYSIYEALNSIPDVTANASAGGDGHVTIDLTGTTDEGQTGEAIFEQISLEVSGHGFHQVDGSPHLWRSDEPFNVGDHDLDGYITGLNGPGIDDADFSVSVTVTQGDPCADITCNDNGTCEDGDCVSCANDGLDVTDDCGSCIDDGRFEVDTYPDCDLDVTAPEGPTISTNAGADFSVPSSQADFDLDGAVATDAERLLVNVDGAGWTAQPHTPGDTDWSYAGTIPTPDTSQTVCVAAEDRAMLQSISTCVTVTREAVDLCMGVTCNGEGTCDGGVCTCNSAGQDPDDDCGSCKTDGLYEDDYPTCPPDITPPSAPEITTNNGQTFSTSQDEFVIEGLTVVDSHELWVRAVKASAPDIGMEIFDWTTVGNYTPGSTDWTYNGTIAGLFVAHEYCFRVEDRAGNQSDEDCVVVSRIP